MQAISKSMLYSLPAVAMNKLVNCSETGFLIHKMEFLLCNDLMSIKR